MFVLYLCVDVTPYYYEIMTRNRPLMLPIMYSNESAWMVPGTVSADD